MYLVIPLTALYGPCMLTWYQECLAKADVRILISRQFRKPDMSRLKTDSSITGSWRRGHHALHDRQVFSLGSPFSLPGDHTYNGISQSCPGPVDHGKSTRPRQQRYDHNRTRRDAHRHGRRRHRQEYRAHGSDSYVQADCQRYRDSYHQSHNNHHHSYEQEYRQPAGQQFQEEPYRGSNREPFQEPYRQTYQLPYRGPNNQDQRREPPVVVRQESGDWPMGHNWW
jgi:hypothetical protein